MPLTRDSRKIILVDISMAIPATSVFLYRLDCMRQYEYRPGGKQSISLSSVKRAQRAQLALLERSK